MNGINTLIHKMKLNIYIKNIFKVSETILFQTFFVPITENKKKFFVTFIGFCYVYRLK